MKLAIIYNKISLTIFYSYIDLKNTDKFVVLYSKNRIRTTDLKKSNRITYIKINKLTLIIFSIISILNKIDLLLIPHHILTNYELLIQKFAKEVHYIDDGMDTLRDRPKNFDLSKYDKSSIYYTFKEYKYLGKWLEGKKVEQIGSIKDLKDDNPPYMINDGILVVESPGLNIQDIEESTKNIYLFQHPNPSKQIKWKKDFVRIDSMEYSVENTILNMINGKIYIGETMSLIICIYLGLSNDIKIVCQLKSLDNLTSIKKLLKQQKNIQVEDTSKR